LAKREKKLGLPHTADMGRRSFKEGVWKEISMVAAQGYIHQQSCVLGRYLSSLRPHRGHCIGGPSLLFAVHICELAVAANLAMSLGASILHDSRAYTPH
jgi:hypothetical protein